MRKILLIILVCLLLILTVFFMVSGFSAFGLKGIIDISEKNKEIDQKILDLSNEVNNVYKSTEAKLKSAADTLTETKTKYENQAILSSSQSSSYVSQKEKYDIEYLWTRLGHFARDENCTLKIDLSTAGENLYNLNFTVGGSYSGITDFIYDIENDSKFGFKIEKFAISSPGESLTATFTCKDIPISKVQVERQSSSNSNTTNNTTNTTDSTSNSTNSTNSTNTTNETEGDS